MPAEPHQQSSLAARLRHVEYEPVIDQFSRELDRRQNFFANYHSLPSGQDSQEDLAKANRTSDTRSMALTGRSRTQHSSTASTYLPSLTTTNTASDADSVSTGLASYLDHQPFLEEENDGVLVQRPELRPTLYRCPFFFLPCSYQSTDEEEWRTHCLSHFRRKPPPRSVQCCMCTGWSATYETGKQAWQVKMDHLAWHAQRGQDVRNSPPDFHLFQHLWQQRVIDDCELQQLRNPPHCLTQVASSDRRWTSTEGGHRDGRRERRRH